MKNYLHTLLAATAIVVCTHHAYCDTKIIYHDAFAAPFELTGICCRDANGDLRRLPAEMDGQLQSSEVASQLVFHTAGAAIRFRTNSDVIYIKAQLSHVMTLTHMTIYGYAGMQMASESGENLKLFSCCCPTPANCAKASDNGFTGTIPLNGRYKLNNGGRLRNLTLYLPLYSGVQKLEIGLDADARLEKPLPQKITKPILFYGSSITQGCSASCPGRSFCALLCGALDAPQLNLGFSGSAHGEQAMAEYIGAQDISAFVMDYDYNAANVQELIDRHAAFYKTARRMQPKLPIIILSGPRDQREKKARDYREVVKKTYDDAIAAGDQYVFFVDGAEYYTDVPWKFTTVDLTHPTDLGFYLMYVKILPVLKTALKVN
ncbi:MAG: hypothetical protein GX927_00710 [Lentisphaerae bacterium]|jgi:hypothetical protein|nr:hypothetical protein [Lentisphaerota bacterium]